MRLRYVNFDLWLRETLLGYEASVDSPVGGAGPVFFPLPFSGGSAHTALAMGETLKTLGRRLFEFIFQGEIRRQWSSCRRMAIDSARVLRLRLNTQSFELWEWPWESLYNDGFLALSPQISLTRWTLVPKPAPRVRRFFSTRVVVVVAPSGKDAETPEREIKAIGESLRGRLDLRILRDVTLGELQAELTRPAHILHFVGHRVCEHADLVAALTRRRAPSLVVLSGCHPAGAAQRLAEEGIPSVLAMRFPDVREAADFTRAFYGSLAAGDPLDRAVWTGRHYLAELDPKAEWLNPVLHLAGDQCLPLRLSGRRIFIP